ncbi:MAG: type II toxin-antitoxin system VapC family toxin [Gemmataceae bacterium]
MTVFDTDIITLLTYGQTPELQERIAALPEDARLAVTVVTMMEVLVPRYDAVYKAANAAEMEKATEGVRSSVEVLDGFEVLYHDPASFRRFTELMAAKAKKVKKKNRADMMTASIVLLNDALLVTRNVKDYAGVPGLRVENWAD